jgi:hypothetical protein
METKVIQMKHLVKSQLKNRVYISHHMKQGGTLRRELLDILANGQIGQKYFTNTTPGKVPAGQESITFKIDYCK